LTIERDTWDGDLAVIEPDFWKYVDGYMARIFSPSELKAKTNLGQPITVETFGTVLREFIAAFGNAAPQAKTFSEAMEASTSLLARETAMKKLKQILADKVQQNSSAMPSEEFEKIAAAAAEEAKEEFSAKAIFGTDDDIQRRKADLVVDVDGEVARARDENDRKLEASLTGLRGLTIAALGTFALDRVSDVTCDWWLDGCQELSNYLGNFYGAVTLWVGFSLFQISEKQGQLGATAAGFELAKVVARDISDLAKQTPQVTLPGKDAEKQEVTKK